MKQSTKTSLVLTLLVLTLALGGMAQVSGAASTAASIELSSDTFLADSLVTIRVYDVAAAGSTFTVYFTYDSSGTDTLEAKTAYANLTVTLGTDEDEWVKTMKFPAPTAGAYVGVHATGSASGSTTDLCADYIDVQEFDDLWPGELIMNIGISLMVALLLVGIVVGLSYVGAKKLRSG